MYREILRKVIPVLAVIAALIIVGFGIYTEAAPKNNAAQPKASSIPNYVPTPTEENKPPFTVQRGDVIREITLTGQITSAAKQELYFKSRGPVDTILVKKNDRVKTGQLLASLYMGQIQFDLKRAQINLDMAKLNLAMAQNQPRPIDPNTQPINLAIKQKQIEMAELEIEDINATIADMQIFAPKDGTVTIIYLSEGDPADQFEPVLQIADLSNLEVLVNPLSEELAGLVVNAPVKMRSSQNPDKVLDGKISSLPAVVSTNNSSPNADEYVHVTLNENPLSAGYHYGDQVQITLVAENKKNVLWLPPAAIDTNGSHNYATIKDAQGERQVEVKVGLKTTSQVEILSGLKEGQGVYPPY
jgi:RND family efflux transporter MFP subunit